MESPLHTLVVLLACVLMCCGAPVNKSHSNSSSNSVTLSATKSRTVTVSLSNGRSSTASGSGSLSGSASTTTSLTASLTSTFTSTSTLSSTTSASASLTSSRTSSHSSSSYLSAAVSATISSTFSLSSTNSVSVSGSRSITLTSSQTSSISGTSSITTSATTSSSLTLTSSQTSSISVLCSSSITTSVTTSSSLTLTTSQTSSISVSGTTSTTTSASTSSSLTLTTSQTSSISVSSTSSVTTSVSTSSSLTLTSSQTISAPLSVSVSSSLSLTTTMSSTTSSSYSQSETLTNSASTTMTSRRSPSSSSTTSNSAFSSQSRSASLSSTDTPSASVLMTPSTTCASLSPSHSSSRKPSSSLSATASQAPPSASFSASSQQSRTSSVTLSLRSSTPTATSPKSPSLRQISKSSSMSISETPSRSRNSKSATGTPSSSVVTETRGFASGTNSLSMFPSGSGTSTPMKSSSRSATLSPTPSESVTFSPTSSRSSLSSTSKTMTTSNSRSRDGLSSSFTSSRSLGTFTRDISSSTTDSLSRSVSQSVSWSGEIMSASATDSATVSRNTSHSINTKDLSATRTATSETTLSASRASPTQSTSASTSRPTTSRTSAASKTSSGSGEQSLTATIRSTRSPTKSRNESKSLTAQTLTLQLTETRSATQTPSASRTLDHPITTSVPLEWGEVGYLRFLRRPVAFAAPFRQIPIAPSLIFQIRGVAAVVDETFASPKGLQCYVRIVQQLVRTAAGLLVPLQQANLPPARIFGVLQVAMVQSVCVFPNIRFDVSLDNFAADLSPEYHLTVAFCANTSKMVNPRVRHHPCNTSTFVVASCPAGREEAVFRLDTNPEPLYTADVLRATTTSATIFNSNQSHGGELIVDVVGSYFDFGSRGSYRCSMTNAMTYAKTGAYGNASQIARFVSGVFIDLCRIRCSFPLPLWAPLLVYPMSNSTISGQMGTGNATLDSVARGSLVAAVVLEDTREGTTFAPTCSGNVARPNDCQSAQQPFLQGQGCWVRLIGSPEPHNFEFKMSSAGDTVFSLQQTTILPSIAISICDAAGNAINSPKLTLNVSIEGQSYPPLVSYSNATLTLSKVTLSSPPFGTPSLDCTSPLQNFLVGAVTNSTRSGPMVLFPQSTYEGNLSSYWWPASMIFSQPVELFGPAGYLSLCMAVQVGAIYKIEVVNEWELPLVADTAVPLYVTPLISGVDAWGNTIGMPGAFSRLLPFPGVNVSASFVQVDSSLALPCATSDGSQTIELWGICCRVVSTVTYDNVTQFPLSAHGLLPPFAGNGFSIMFELNQGIPKTFLDNPVGLINTTLRKVLWAENSTTEIPFPRGRSMTVSDCGTLSVFSVTRSEFSVSADSNGTCYRSPAFVSFNNTVPQVGGTVLVYGSGFAHVTSANSTNLCHLSSWFAPFELKRSTNFVPGGSVAATFVSSCLIQCALPPQPFPIGATSNVIVDANGNIAPRTSHAAASIGQLRIRSNGVWSSPLSMSVVGAASRIEAIGWTQRYANRLILTIAGFDVVLQDQVGNSVEWFDRSIRQLSLTYVPQKVVQLNGTTPIDQSATTCNGFGSFSSFVVSSTSGDFALTLSSSSLASTTLFLSVFTEVVINHTTKLLSPFPLCFVSVTSDRSSTENGLLPVAPTVGAFSRASNQSSIDTSVTDVSLIAVVERAAEFAHANSGGMPEYGVGLSDCNKDYGNCYYLDAGYAVFSSFRFVGIPGFSYNVVIRALNTSLAMSNVSFRVRVPSCPVNSTSSDSPLMSAIQTVNSSLVSPSGGVIAKGWRYPIPSALLEVNSVANFAFSCPIGDSLYLSGEMGPTLQRNVDNTVACLFGSSIFPAAFIDICTVSCFTDDLFTSDPSWVNGSGVNATHQGFNNSDICTYHAYTDSVECAQAVTNPIQVRIANASLAKGGTTISHYESVFAGLFTFIGRLKSIVVVPNVRGNQSIFGNQQLVPSSEVAMLDTIIVSLVDELGNTLGTTAPSDVEVWVSDIAVQSPMNLSPLPIPGNFTLQLLDSVGRIVGGDNHSCTVRRRSSCQLFTRQSAGGQGNSTTNFDLSLRGMKWAMRNGTASIENVAMILPSVGVFQIAIFARELSTNHTVATNATVYVSPGKPIGACLATNLANVTIDNERLLSPQPKLYTFDAAGNFYQSALRSSSDVGKRPDLALIEGIASAVTVGFSFDYLDEVNQTWRSNVTGGGPIGEFVSDVEVLQFLFSNLSLTAVHSVAYRLVFSGPLLNISATSSKLVVKSCNPTEHTFPMDLTCSPCPSGLGINCIGGSNAQCFVCNGTTQMLLTGNYWRYGTQSEYAYSCPSSSCMDKTETGTCLPGYRQEGNPLCDACADGYAKDFLGSCVPCAANWVSIFVVVLIIILAAVVIFVFIYLSVKGAMEDDENDNHLVMMLKIFMNFTQITGMLGEFRVNFTGYVLNYFNFIGAATGGSGVSISPVNCMMPELTFLDKMNGQLVLPIFVLASVGVCLGIMHCRRVRKERRLAKEAQESLYALQQVLIDEERFDDSNETAVEMTEIEAAPEDSSLQGAKLANKKNKGAVITAKKTKRKHVPYRQVFGNASMILVFVLYQSIVTQCITTFNCQTLFVGRQGAPEALKVLDKDVRVQCHGESYENHVAIATYGVFIYAVFLPMFTMTFVLHQARNIGWTKTYAQFSFLIKGFRLKFWYWEFVVVFRKVGLRFLIATVTDATLQALLGIWFLTALFVLQTYAKPYVLSIHNHADQLSLMTALITINIGLAFNTYNQECTLICGAFSVLLVLSNVVVLSFFAAQIAWGAYLRLVEEFGIDTPSGDRWISLRNLKNIVLVALKKNHMTSPSFRTYTPRPLCPALARSVLQFEYDDDDEEEWQAEYRMLQESNAVVGKEEQAVNQELPAFSDEVNKDQLMAAADSLEYSPPSLAAAAPSRQPASEAASEAGMLSAGTMRPQQDYNLHSGRRRRATLGPTAPPRSDPLNLFAEQSESLPENSLPYNE